MRLCDIDDIVSLVNWQDLITAGPGVTVKTAAVIMADHNIGAVLVCDSDGALVGIFTERDLLIRIAAAGRDPAGTTLGEVMTAAPQTVSLQHKLQDVLDIMLTGRFRHLPVVTDTTKAAGRDLIGVISARDLLRLMKHATLPARPVTAG